VLLQSIELKVDNCQMSSCLSLTTPQGPNEFLNVNGPLQLGGTVVNLNDIANSMNWTHRPTTQNFAGCVRNLRVNEKVSCVCADGKGCVSQCSQGHQFNSIKIAEWLMNWEGFGSKHN
jgi:hypothetical protein